MSDQEFNSTLQASHRATLHMLCGKIAAGKSTLTAELGRMPSTVVISEDFWLSRLFGPEMNDVADYIRYSRRLREAVGPHVQDLLRLGVCGFRKSPDRISGNLRTQFSVIPGQQFR